MPSVANAFSSCAGESGLTCRPPNAAEIWAARSASRGGRNPGPGRAAEQAGQQGVVHVSPPRHAAGAHLGCGQAARGLHRGQQAEPGRVGIRGDPAQLVRVHTDQRPEDLTRLGDSGLGRAEQGGLPGGGWPARRARGGQTRAGQTRAGQTRAGLTRDGLAGGAQACALAGAQQGLGEGGVVAAVHPDPTVQQGRVDRGRVSPDPAHMFATWPGALVLRHRRREIVDQGGRGVAAAVLGEFLQEGRAPGPGSYRNPHASESPPSRRQSGAADREFPGVWPRPGPWAGRAGSRRLHPQPEGGPWCPPTGPENLAGVTAACNRPDLSDG